jgi:cell division protein ZapA (FtsZ GTPase activity inhibitor)
MQNQSTTRIMKALEMLMNVNDTSVSRSLRTIKRYSLSPDRIDDAILAAINASLCLVSNGNDHVADGFNDDVTRNGRNFSRANDVIAWA